jgi:hypothetical protein
VGRPEWRPERGITGSAVEAQAQAMISQPQRVSCPRREQQEGQHARASTMGSDHRRDRHPSGVRHRHRGRGRAAYTVMTQKYYAFDINKGTTDPGFIPVPGTSPRTFSPGDQLIINDQLTTRVNGRYPIVGYDSGMCTLTGTPGKNAEQTLANCVVTAIS